MDIDRIQSSPPASEATSAVATNSKRPAWIAAAVCAAVAAGAIAFALRPRPAGEEMRLSLMTPPQGAGEFAISPDGTGVAIAGLGAQNVWVRRLNRSEAEPLPVVAPDARFPFWSADSRFLVYWSSGKLWKVDSA